MSRAVATQWALTFVGGGLASFLTASYFHLNPLAGAPTLKGTIVVTQANGSVALLSVDSSSPALTLQLPDVVEPAKAPDPRAAVEFESDSWDAGRKLFWAVYQAQGTGDAPYSAIATSEADGSSEQLLFDTSTATLRTVSPDPATPSRQPKRGDFAYVTTADDTHYETHASVWDGSEKAPHRIADSATGTVTWSGDGRYVAYGCFPAPGPPRLCVTDTATGKGRQVTVPGLTNYSQPAFAPRGHDLVFVGDGGPNEVESSVVVYDMDRGTSVTAVRRNLALASPTWSPDGGWIAFDTPGRVVLHRLSDGAEVTLADMEGGDAFSTLQWTSTELGSFGLS